MNHALFQRIREWRCCDRMCHASLRSRLVVVATWVSLVLFTAIAAASETQDEVEEASDR